MLSARTVTAPKKSRPARRGSLGELTLSPIGFVRSPFLDRVSTPRQPAAARGVCGTIELLPDQNFEHALADLEAWDHIWVVFWFHLNAGWRPKVLPPRSTKRRGVFATRSPHRPNPLGLSVLALEAVDGLTLHVRDVDLLDGTPVLDIKPYVPFTDVVPSANTGWLETPDPGPKFTVAWSATAEAQAAWLRDNFRVDLTTQVSEILSLGHEPHPYRRIRRREQGYRLAVKDWRVDFTVEGTTINVAAIRTGYRPGQLAAASIEPALALHRAFVEHFGKL
ncbi:MAG TPA: tRNA (N6-threonylcarbamoyladenosine(37)-N6)-methyltransferase TrmO [Polyangiaceae bacterium]|nr:tRNA (N6-threonylcarbamoyladenosine(37)-N6)-methyltransferase TrmO [Polyangiaceae bacterium]